MKLDPPTANTRSSQLAIHLALFAFSVFAIVAAVGIYRLQLIGRADGRQAAREAESVARQRDKAFVAAIGAKDSQTVGELLAAGANPNNPDARPSPLERAISSGDIDTVKLLIGAGASVNARGPESPIAVAGRSPIEHSQKVVILRELLNHGANITHDRHAADICFASQSPEIVALLRKRGAAYGRREMALAGDMEGLQTALAKDPGLLSRPLTTYCMGSKTLLGVALRHGHEDLANWMLDEGAPLEVHEVSQGSALHIAAVGDCAGVMPRLCRMGCDPNAGDDSGLTPLDYCISTASPATIKALLDSGADVNRTAPGLRNTPLQRTVLRYDAQNQSPSNNRATLEIIALLLDAGADPDIADAEGRTARELARTRSSAVLDLFERP